MKDGRSSSHPEPVCPSGIKRFQFRAENVLLPTPPPPSTWTEVHWQHLKDRTVIDHLSDCVLETAELTQTPQQLQKLRLSAQRRSERQSERDLCSEVV